MSRQSKFPRGPSPQSAPRESPRRRESTRLSVRRATAFVAAAALVAYLAFDGGGYDVMVRQTVAIFVWGAIAVGFAHGILPRSLPHRMALVPFCAAIGLLLWMIVSFAWTASDERTSAEVARYLGYVGIAVLALTALNRNTFRAAAAGVSIAAFCVALLAVMSRLAPSSFPGATELAAAIGTDRLNYPLDSWNAIGAWGAMCFAIGLAWSADARRRATRAVSLAAAPVAGIAVYLSYSRGGVVGTATAVIAVVILSRRRGIAAAHALAAAAGTGLVIVAVRANSEIAQATGAAGAWQVVLALLAAAALCAGAVWISPEWTRWMGQRALRSPRAVALVGALAAVCATVALLGPISDWWAEFRSEGTPISTADPAARLTEAGGNRADIWSSALDAFADDPVRGLGPGTFEFWWLREGGDPEYVRDAHSLYLEEAAELGLLGLLLLLVALGGLGAMALAARRRLERPDDVAACVALTCAFAVFCVTAAFEWLWEETAVAALGIGGVCVAAAAGFPRRSREGRQGVLFRPGVRAAVVAAAVLAVIAQVPGIVSTDRVRASEDALRAGDLENATSYAQEAVDAQPWAAHPRAQLAVVQRETGLLDAAEDTVAEAIEREPDNWEWPLILTSIQAEAGDRRAARRTFTAGRALAPGLPYYSPFSVYGRDVYTERQLEELILDADAGDPDP